jgi:A/G-specific adenine glycosylase
MLQQTQVSRVLSKYEEFISAFPEWSALARASVSEVLAVWKGMGYPRRALALRKIAATVTEEHGGELPAVYEKLVALPSIGEATACSILAFAFGKPTVFIETNIRAVFIRFFFEGSESVRDREIRPLVDITLDRRNPRKWYYALMDYGVQLKKTDPSLLAKSAHYRKQSPFRGSTRELRSRILSLVASNPGISDYSIRHHVKDEPEKVTLCLSALRREGFIEKNGRGYAIAGEDIRT